MKLWHYPMVRHLADGNALPVRVLIPHRRGLEATGQPTAALLLSGSWFNVLD